jgi:superfamily II DNA or RNA helicase
VNRQRRLEAKKKRRERENRLARQRRHGSNQSLSLVMQAEAAWHGAGDREEARRLLEKALRIHPGSQQAHAGLADLDIRAGRFADGFSHYERLVDPAPWPHLVHMASVAAYQLARFDRAHALAKQFLRLADGDPELEPIRAQAHQIADSARALARRKPEPNPVEPPLRRDARRQHHPRMDAGGVRRSSIREGADPQKLRRDVRPAVPAEQDARPTVAPRHATSRRRRDDRFVADATGSSQRKADPALDPQLPEFPTVTLPSFTVQYEVDGHSPLTSGAHEVGTLADVVLRRDFAELRLQRGFDELLAPGTAQGLEHFWFQLETVRRLLRDFRGRALLADEVGLGKTIEACLALKEYWMRGLVTRALILTPPSLVSQWADELASKFGLAAAVAESGKVGPDDEIWRRAPLVVASLPLARQRAYRASLTAIEYDLVIVDEAHVLRNRTSAAWQLVNDLKKRFLFLLSATPVGNDLSELYNLILLLKPGLLKTEAQFRRDFGGVHALRQPERRERLRMLLREVMIRNTRAHIDVRLPRRLAATEVIAPTNAEGELHERLASFICAQYGTGGTTDRWRLMMLQMQAGSSPAALRAALDRLESHASDPLPDVGQLRTILGQVGRSAKTSALIRLLTRSAEKTIVFTRFRATLEHLRGSLEHAGFRVEAFHGGLTAAEKDRAMERFEHAADVLVSSEVGGEGRNLQFCRTVINYDLPWNPMQLEQRVGRVHRIGQTREVFVFNLCLAGSLEEYILKVLHDKLNLFELVAGEIEMILGEFDPDRDFAEIVMDLWARSATAGERECAFEELADHLIAARRRYETTQEIDRTLFREEFEV